MNTEWGLSPRRSHLKHQALNPQCVCICSDSETLHASWKNLIYLIWVIWNFFSAPKHRSGAQDLRILSLHCPLSCPVMTKWRSPDGQRKGGRRWRCVALHPYKLSFRTQDLKFVALTGLPQGSLPDVKFDGSTLSVPGFYVASYLNLE